MRLDSWFSETLLATRALIRSPGYSAVIVGTLALGIAAVTVVLGVFSPYFLRPLPLQEPDRLLHLGHVSPETGYDGARFSGPQLRDLQEEVSSFEDFGAYFYGTVNLADESGALEPERIMNAWMTENLFGILGPRLLRGRGIQTGDLGQNVVVVGESLWRSRWGADPGLVGRTIQVDDRPHVVVGIAPSEFSFPFNEVLLWRALDLGLQTDRSEAGMLVVGRLTPGATVASARAELATVHGNLAADHPEEDGKYSNIVAKDLRASLNFAWEPLRISFFVLLGAVGALLLLACVNVANLVLARGLSKQREMAVRSALGGRPLEIIRPMLAESGILALVGGALGLLLARFSLVVLAPLAPDGLFRVGALGLDGAVVRWSLLVLFATPFLFGLLPAWSTGRAALAGALRGGARGGGTVQAARARRALVVTQITLALILVAGAGLMARSLVALQDVDLGFEAETVLAVEITPPESRYPDRESLGSFWRQAAEEVRGTAGVRAVGSTSRLPLNHETSRARLAGADNDQAPDTWPSGLVSRVSPGYFDAMQVPVVRGRSFRAEDAAGDGVLISQALAERLWPGESPVDRSVRWHQGRELVSARVLGEVGDVRFGDLTGEGNGHLYLPLEGASTRRRFLVVGVVGTPSTALKAVREAISRVDPTLPISARPMPAVVQESTLQWQISSVFLGVFGGLALVLASLGVYGVVAWSVRSRRREIGIRMALGAAQSRILSLVVGDGLRMVVWGVGIGLVIVGALSPVLGSVLFGVEALDPITLLAVVGLLAAAAVTAALVPARQASNVAPSTVLRDD